MEISNRLSHSQPPSLNPHPVRLACVKISFCLLTPYAQLGKTGYQHIVSFISQLDRTAAEVLPRVRLKRWIFGTHQGLVSVKCLDLEEFTFRFNRRCARITHCRASLAPPQRPTPSFCKTSAARLPKREPASPLPLDGSWRPTCG